MASKFKSSANLIRLDQAVGKVLAHDITEIRPGQFKGAAFKKGYIVKEKDIAHLRRLGKEHLFVLEMEPGEVHEDEAAMRLAKALAGPGVTFDSRPSEGKATLRAARRGLLKVRVEALTRLNMIPDVSCASRHNNTLVAEGDIIAGTRAIPLIIDETHLLEAEGIAGSEGGVFSVKALASPDIGLIVTGNEVYNGIIEDKFAPLIRKKVQEYGCRLLEHVYVPDDREKIAAEIHRLLKRGVGLLMVAGGMSVDPDDVSRAAIAQADAQDVVYGTPVLPGAMFLCGRIADIPILGLPACVLFYRATVLDLLLPRVLAGETISRKDLADMAHGGLCLNCEACQYPVCPFGK